jgi:hypothetical protein
MGIREELKSKFVTGYKITSEDYATWLDNGLFGSDVVSGDEGRLGLTTGVLSGGMITINPDNTTIDIAEGKSLYVDLSDFNNPIVEVLSWNAQNVDPNITINTRPWVGIQRSGIGSATFIFSENFTALEKRTIAILGRAWTFDHTTIAGVGQYSSPALYLGNTLIDFLDTMGSLNKQGNSFTAYDSTLTLNRSAGISFRYSSNFSEQPLSPNIIYSNPATAINSYNYHLSNQYLTTEFNQLQPNFYDVDGILTAVPSNKFSIQYIYYFPSSDVVDVIYGHNVYGSLSDAIASSDTENQDIGIENLQSLEGSILRAKIIMQQGVTDLSDPTKVKIIDVSNFGAGISLNTNIVDHNLLTNLQGGLPTSAGEFYHVNQSEYNNIHSGTPLLSKSATAGIKVDLITPTYPWQDIIGISTVRGSGLNNPLWSIYNGNISQYEFSLNKEIWFNYHIPHDYVKGTDLFIHTHWSHTTSGVTSGSVTWGFNVTAAKGHQQETFINPINTSVTQLASIGASGQYRHMIAEVQLSSNSPSASQINNSLIEPDSVILVRCYLSSYDIVGGTGSVFLHYTDIHYQSTGIGTKQKSPDFYV